MTLTLNLYLEILVVALADIVDRKHDQSEATMQGDRDPNMRVRVRVRVKIRDRVRD